MKYALLVICLGASSLFGAGRYPFPYVAAYPYGAHTGRVEDANQALAAMKGWLKTDYAECTDGSARVKWLDPSRGETGMKTLSKGIGYGMLITVYMDNDSIGNKARFDKLWAFYKKNRSPSGLMHREIQGCSQGAIDNTSESGADLDVALALVMASKQWNVDQYRIDAIKLLNDIWSNELAQGRFLLRSFEMDGRPYNTGYMSLGALRLFKQVDTPHDWARVADSSLALLMRAQNSSTGLVPDWIDEYGTSRDVNGSGINKFGIEAVPVPWRVLIDYLWFGTANAKGFLAKIDTWIKAKSGSAPSGIAKLYSTDGSTADIQSNALYTGALVVPGMATSASGDWISSGASALAGYSTDNTYDDSWKVLHLLTLSGGFQNFWGTVKPNTGVVRGMADRKGSSCWTVRSREGVVRVELDAPGSAELVDASGRVVGAAEGGTVLEIVHPAGAGIRFVHARTAWDHAVIPIVGR